MLFQLSYVGALGLGLPAGIGQAWGAFLVGFGHASPNTRSLV